MTLLITLVLTDEVEVVTTDDDGAVHLVSADDTLEDATTDGDRRCEWALLIDICTLDGLLWGLKAQTDRLVITDDTVRLLGRDTGEDLGNTLLLLESALDLLSHVDKVLSL